MTTTDRWPRLLTDPRDEQLVLSCALAVGESAPVPSQSPPYLKQDLWAKPLVLSNLVSGAVAPHIPRFLVLEVPPSVEHITVIRYYCLTTDSAVVVPSPGIFEATFEFELDGLPIPGFAPILRRCGIENDDLPRAWQETHLVYLPKRTLRVWASYSIWGTPFVAGAAVSGWRYLIRDTTEPTESLVGGAYDAGRV